MLRLLFTFALGLSFAGQATAASISDHSGGALACLTSLKVSLGTDLRFKGIQSVVGLGEDELAELLREGKLPYPQRKLNFHAVNKSLHGAIIAADGDALQRSRAGLVRRRARARHLRGQTYDDFTFQLFEILFEGGDGVDFLSPNFAQLARAMAHVSFAVAGVRSSPLNERTPTHFFGHQIGLDLADPKNQKMYEELFARLPKLSGAVLGVGARATAISQPNSDGFTGPRFLLLSDVLAVQLDSPVEHAHLRHLLKDQP